MAKVTRLIDLVPNFLEKYPERPIFGHKQDGEWKTISIQEYAERVNNLSYAFLKLGIEKNDKVAIVSNNRPEWNMIDMATLQIGAVSVPIYPTISMEDYLYIFNHAEIKLLVIEWKVLRRIEKIFPQVKSLKNIYTFIPIEGYPHLAQLETLGKENPVPEKLEALRNGITPENLATIIYTSGTTGDPKGVMLSHKNIVTNIEGVQDIPAPWVRRTLSFLPLCHAYERTLVYLYQYLGFTTYYAENLGAIAENIKEVDPNLMCCVPRLLEKIYDKLFAAGKNQKGISKIIYYWAFSVAKRYEITGNTLYYKCIHKIADKLVFGKWREALGGHFDIVVSGGSSLQTPIARFFSGIGMPVYEGYGLTETSPVIAVSRRGKYQRKAGTVGPIMPNVEVKITENGEICCRGNSVMIGYYKDPERTAEVIDNEGWFHTGDIGKFDKHGRLIITGRLKNIFKTSFGKYINPQKIENKCCESPFISNMIVVGENQKFAAALIVPDFEFLKAWCNRYNIKYTTDEEMVTNKDVNDRYRKELAKYNNKFGDWEQIKKFELIADDWSESSGILTPTLKVKRNIVVEEKYAEKIEKLFS